MSELTILEKLGGDNSIRVIVDILYAKLISDDLLKEFFLNTDLAKVKCLLISFLINVLGGLNIYKGKSMKETHAKLGIKDIHFDKFEKIFVGILQDLKIKNDLIDEVVAIIIPLRKDIVTM